MNILITANDCHEQGPMKKQCLQYERCPIVLVQEILAGKWKILILWYMNYNTLRLCDLKKLLPQVTQSMLLKQLRELIEDKLIYKEIYPVVPPKVEYGLTEVGKKILPILDLMYNFGTSYLNAGLHK